MRSTLLALILSALISAMATPLVRRLALAVGAVDDPGARRVHTRRIPRLGGIAMVVAFFLPLLLLLAAKTHVSQLFFARGRMVAGLVVGSLVCTTLGALDDLVGVKAKHKLLVQALAATIAYAAGFRIEAVTLPFLGEIRMQLLAMPATVFWIVGLVNALNLIDGLDGLAGGVAFFACITNFVVAYLGGNVLVCLLAATLAGAIVGFLFHNFNPATIFMGDSGSMFLGYVLATTSLFASQKGGTAVAILVPVVALGVPVMDTMLTLARRFVERRSIFRADRGHIHHKLLDLGLSHRRAVLILYGASVLFTLASLAIYIGRSWQVGLTLAAIAGVVIALVRFVGYFNSVLLMKAQTVRGPKVEALRKATPDVIARLRQAPSFDDVRLLLERFAAEVPLLAVDFVAAGGAKFQAWCWKTLEDQKPGVEEVSVKFPLRDGGGKTHHLRFAWDAPGSDLSPQAEILLQLVADAVEQQMKRPSLISEGAPRPGDLAAKEKTTVTRRAVS
jgi:UDP-GlcNAc:undecaprenyl-phosphate GlcNAc-1-phosphate transferase